MAAATQRSGEGRASASFGRGSGLGNVQNRLEVWYGAVFLNGENKMGAALKAIKVTDNKTNGGQSVVNSSMPWLVTVAIQGSSDMLFHRWNCEAVDAKAKAAKGSKRRRPTTSRLRLPRRQGQLACPASICGSRSSTPPSSSRTRAARASRQWTVQGGVDLADRSGAASASSNGTMDRRRAVIQRSAITRTRPGRRESAGKRRSS